MYCWTNILKILDRGWRKRIIRCMDKLHEIHFVERKGHLTGVHGQGRD